MSYEPTVWATGDVITSTKLNKLENGLAEASGGGGGGVLVANLDPQTGALDKTWNEISSSSFAVVKLELMPNSYEIRPVYSILVAPNDPRYTIMVIKIVNAEVGVMIFTATSADDYPVTQV